MRLSLVAFAGISVSLLLTGCGFGSQDVAIDNPSVLNGKVMGGQSPIAGAEIKLYTFGSTGYGLSGNELESTTTHSDGTFTLAAPSCPQPNTPVYLLSSGGNTGGGDNPTAVLAVTLGPCGSINGNVVINEVTTAITAFALAHYFNDIDGGYNQGDDSFGGPSTGSAPNIVYSQGIVNATTVTIPELVNTQIGFANASVNGASGSVIEEAKIYTIANILAACVNTTGPTSYTETTTICGQLFGYTMDYSNVRPFDTLQAAVQMALYPTAHVKSLYNLIPPIGFSFGGYNTTVPKDFSIGVSYTTANASLAVPTDAVATLDIDSAGNVWFPSNGPGQIGLMHFYSQGSTGFLGPFNTTSMAFPTQVAIDGSGYAWLNDTASPVVSAYQTTNPTSTMAFPGVSNQVFTALTINDDNSVVVGSVHGGLPGLAQINTARTTFLGLSNSFVNYPVVSLAGDSVGGDSITTTNTGSGSGTSLYYYGPPNPLISAPSYTADLVATDAGIAGQTIFQGTDFVSITTGFGSASDDLCVFTIQSCSPIYPQSQRPTNVVIDGTASLWASAGSAAAVLQIPQYSTYAPGGTSYLDTNYDPARAEANELFHGTNNGGTMTNPAAIAVDFAGNVWVANAGCTTTGCTPGNFVLSEIVGSVAPTITPIAQQILANTPLTGTQPPY